MLVYVGNVRDLACLSDGREWRGSVWLIRAVLVERLLALKELRGASGNLVSFESRY